MRRWFALSAYVKSFIIDADRLRPAEEIAARHDRFIQSLAPTRRIVFFPAPELKAAFPDHVKAVMAEARRILLETLAKHPSVLHVDIDYQACGVVDSDFWQEAAMYFDIPHAKPDAVPKLTKCLADALARAGVANAVTTP
jgi:hypothetical protein